jgi:hypothetical protein
VKLLGGANPGIATYIFLPKKGFLIRGRVWISLSGKKCGVPVYPEIFYQQQGEVPSCPTYMAVLLAPSYHLANTRVFVEW